jgi:hypothetical protein
MNTERDDGDEAECKPRVVFDNARGVVTLRFELLCAWTVTNGEAYAITALAGEIFIALQLVGELWEALADDV